MQQKKVTCIFEASSKLGESPLWHPHENALYWVDIEGCLLHCLNPPTGVHRQWSMPSEIGCIGLASRSGLVAALRDSFVHIHLPSGEVALIDTPLTAEQGVMFNDGKCDRAGRFWAGTKDLLEQSDIGSLYYLDSERQCTESITGFAVSNGIAWSPDNTTFYICNSPAKVIYQYDFDLATAALSNRRVFATLPADAGYPDGLTVDSEGCIWNAHWDGFRITRYLPNGKIDNVIEMPVQRPTSCCFGGVDLTTLFVTSASTRMTAEELEKSPLSGAVFAIDVGIKGIPEPLFLG